MPSSASRSLCDECGRFNWQYHLTRHLEDQPKDAMYRYEETLVNTLLQESRRDFSDEEDSRDDGTENDDSEDDDAEHEDL